MSNWKTAFRSFYYETAEEPEDIVLDPASTALLVIDIQNTYLEAPDDATEARRWQPFFDRMNETVIGLVREFNSANKPIAAICHAPWLLAEAGIIDGRTVTGWPSIRTDLKNAGGDVVDESAVVDGNLITSRQPEDVPDFNAAIAKAVCG